MLVLSICSLYFYVQTKAGRKALEQELAELTVEEERIRSKLEKYRSLPAAPREIPELANLLNISDEKIHVIVLYGCYKCAFTSKVYWIKDWMIKRNLSDEIVFHKVGVKINSSLYKEISKLVGFGEYFSEGRIVILYLNQSFAFEGVEPVNWILSALDFFLEQMKSTPHSFFNGAITSEASQSLTC